MGQMPRSQNSTHILRPREACSGGAVAGLLDHPEVKDFLASDRLVCRLVLLFG
jgi:hypothetical protein